jgi:hypothetical protein
MVCRGGVAEFVNRCRDSIHREVDAFFGGLDNPTNGLAWAGLYGVRLHAAQAAATSATRAIANL